MNKDREDQHIDAPVGIEYDAGKHDIEKGNRTYSYLIIAGVLLFIFGVVVFILLNIGKTGESGWILISIAILLIVFGLIFAYKMKNQRSPHEPDYYTLFTMGIIWLPLGIALDMLPLTVMGVIFMLVGLRNKNKWRKRTLADLSENERKANGIMIFILGLLVIGGLVAYFIVR